MHSEHERGQHVDIALGMGSLTSLTLILLSPHPELTKQNLRHDQSKCAGSVLTPQRPADQHWKMNSCGVQLACPLPTGGEACWRSQLFSPTISHF